MSLIAIAALYNEIIQGYRILDTQTGEMRDASIDSVADVLQYKSVKVDNLRIVEWTIIGTNGSVERLPKVWNGQLIGNKSPVIIINQIDDIGYTVTDYKGSIEKWRTQDVLDYATKHGIANGKIVYRNGEAYISPIEGSYKQVRQVDKDLQTKIDRMNLKAQPLGLPYKIGSYGELIITDKKLNSIIIPDIITKIDAGTFKNCINLRQVRLPNTITNIEEYAFEGCLALEDINIPSGITTINQGVFSGCSRLDHIKLPNSINTIGRKAFEGCRSLQGIELSDSIIKICERAFSSSGLAAINIPKNLEELEDRVFSECQLLESVDLSNSKKLNTLPLALFEKCRVLQNVQMHDNIESIGAYAFSECRQLKTIKLPSSLQVIHDSAFASCNSLKTITIPDTVSAIEDSAFMGCSSLENVQLPKKLERISYRVFKHCQKLKDIKLPNSLTAIGVEGFFGCISLRYIKIPQSIINIHSRAFKMCTSLSEIELPRNRSPYINNDAFNDCQELRVIKAHPNTKLHRLEIFAYNDNIKVERYETKD